MEWSVPRPDLRSPRRLAARRYRVIALAVVALLCTYILVVVNRAEAAETLLSQGKPTTASSAENAATPASAATDGDPGTRWSSAFSVPQWIQVDLGSTQSITRVALNWETAYATAFTIQTSTDGTAWTNAYSTTTGAGGNQSLTVSGSGRYVRLTATAKATQYGISLWEFQVYGGSGTPGACGTANAALNKPASTSSTENAGSCGATAITLIPTRGGNGTLEALADEGRFAPPTLADLERGLADALTRAHGSGARIFADLWDLERVSRCDACVDARGARLAAMNHAQEVLPAPACTRCGAAS